MGRAPCCINGHTHKGTWTKQEDQLLISYIQANGHGCWRALPKAAGLQRCGKSCRLRWLNYLRPDLKRGNFTEEDEKFIVEMHSKIGNKWSQIASMMKGRTDNEIKNHWNTHIKRKLLASGIDPQTHQPINANTCTSPQAREKGVVVVVSQGPPATDDAVPKPPVSSAGAVAASSTRSSGISTDEEDRRMPQLDLNLTISLPVYVLPAEAATPSSAPPGNRTDAQTIGMCRQLDVNGEEGRCGCTP